MLQMYPGANIRINSELMQICIKFTSVIVGRSAAASVSKPRPTATAAEVGGAGQRAGVDRPTAHATRPQRGQRTR